MDPPLLRPSCLACAQVQLACDGRLPCGWTSDLSEVESWPEPVYLKQGVTGSARLATALTKEGKVKRIDWQLVLGQQQDLRIRPSTSDPVHHYFPPTISGDHEHETTEQLGDRINFVSDVETLNNFSFLAPHDPIPPTILLNSALLARPPRASHRITTAFAPWDLNVGNTMSIASSPTSDGSAVAAWRRGDESGRGTAVGWGSVQARSDPEQLANALNPISNRSTPMIDPFPAPLVRTLSPILQLRLAALPTATASALLAIRTQTQLKLLQLGLESSPPTSLASFDYTGSAMGRRPIGDIALGGVVPLHGEPGGGLVADVDGGLWGWGLGARGTGRIGDADWREGQPEMFRLRRGRKKGDSGYSGFVRVGYGGARGSDAVVALEDEVLLYDLRSPTAFSTLVDPDLLARHVPFGQVGSSLLTSLLQRSPQSAARPSGMHVVSTTRDVLWIDERMPGKELLRWAHDRVSKEGKGFDRTLSLLEVPSTERRGDADAPHRVALHSRLHPMVSVYTYSSSAICPPRSLLDPYTLPSPTPTADCPFVRSGLSIMSLDAPREGEKGGRWLVAEVGNDGAVYQRVCSTRAEEEEEDVDDAPAAAIATQWSDEVAEFGRAFAARKREGVDGGPIGSKEFAETKRLNMTKVDAAVSERLEKMAEMGVEEGLEERMERVGEMMRRGRDDGEDAESGVLTAQELLHYAEQKKIKTREDSMDVDGEDRLPFSVPELPTLPRSSTFDNASQPLSLSAVGSKSQLQKLVEALSSTAGWSSLPLDISRNQPSSSKLRDQVAPDLPDGLSDMSKSAKTLKLRYGVDVDSDEEDVPPVRRAKSLACDEVILDMALSSILAHPRPMLLSAPPDNINTPHPPDQSPPPILFSHFRPQLHVKGKPVDGYSSADDDSDLPVDTWKKPSLKSEGVRALLSEWHVGSDPRFYAWINPYADEQAKDDPFSQSQAKEDKKRKRKRERSTVAPSSFAFPSSQPSSSAFPSSYSFQPAPPVKHSLSQAAPQPVQRIPSIADEVRSSSPGPAFAASQPQLLRASNGDSQSLRAPSAFGPAASQILPGAFGGRAFGAGEREKKERDKKKAKKRVSGF